MPPTRSARFVTDATLPLASCGPRSDAARATPLVNFSSAVSEGVRSRSTKEGRESPVPEAATAVLPKHQRRARTPVYVRLTPLVARTSLIDKLGHQPDVRSLVIDGWLGQLP